MIRKFTLLLASILILSSIVFAFTKPDYNGAWVLDRARSFGMPGNMTQTMTVKQTADQIEVETKLIQPGNERSVKDIYMLDGKEQEFAPPVPANAPADAPKPKGVRTFQWLANDGGFMVTEVTTVTVPKPATTQVIKKWTYTADGELTIATFIDGPNGSFEAKRIFTKKKE